MSRYTDAVERGLQGLDAVSTGVCPGCDDCADVCDEGSFSWEGCGICGSPLGGDRYAWHAILKGEIVHFDDACVDCVMYLANGDEPDAWGDDA